MSFPSRRTGLVVVTALAVGAIALAAPSGATVRSGTAPRFEGAFEFEGLAATSAGKSCRGEGSFGEMKRGARVLLSERVASGDFETLGRGKIGKGKVVDIDGDAGCRMPFTVKARREPAGDSRIYLEVKGVTFDISWPAADVADGDLGTWRCEFDDTTCAAVVGE